MGRVHRFGSSWTAMSSCICDISLAVGSVLSWTMKVRRLTLIDLIGLGQFDTLTSINFAVFVGQSQMEKPQDPELSVSSPENLASFAFLNFSTNF